MSLRSVRPSIGWAPAAALTICVGMGVAFVVANVLSWQFEDADVYWDAALRLRHGADLYPASGLHVAEPYRYAPWFAWAWVPLTYLPKLAVQVGWGAALLLACAVAIRPMLRTPSVAGVCLAAILGGLLFRTATTGNVHALLVAAVVAGMPRRSGPIWIGVAASLKVAPIAFALLYLGRREWWRAMAAVLVAIALWAPALLYGIADYPSAPGQSMSLLSWAGPWPWLLGAAVMVALALRLAPTRHAPAAAATAVLAVLPRLLIYDLTWLLAGTARVSSPTASIVAGTRKAR